MPETTDKTTWIEAGNEADFPEGLGVCIKHNDDQIAVFNYNGEEWYAAQNSCPHEDQMVLSRGLTGEAKGEPKVACPLHKRSFSLRSGEFLGEGEMSCLNTYEVKREGGKVFVKV